VTTVALSFGLITALLLGSWTLLKPSSDPLSPASARPTPTGSTGPTSVAVARRQAPDLTEAEPKEEPNPFVTAIREVVGPQMSESDLDELARQVNLLCVGSSTAQAQAHLIEDGMSPATAKALIRDACAIS
jgi:hypothetical protein